MHTSGESSLCRNLSAFGNMATANPLQQHVLQFAHILGQIYGDVCIAGSAPLTDYLRRLPDRFVDMPNELAEVCGKITSNDVDVFVPMILRSHQLKTLIRDGITREQWFAYKRARCNSGAGTNSEPFVEPIDGLLVDPESKIEDIILATRKLFGTFTVEFADHQDGRIDYSTWGVLMNIGQVKIYPFDLHTVDGTEPIRVQLIEVCAFEPANTPWSSYITSTFDIDVAMGRAELHVTTILGMVFMPDRAVTSIHNCGFEYRVLACYTFEHHMCRILKYIRKGFKLRRLYFDTLCCPEYKAYIMSRFHSYCAGSLAMDILQDLEMDYGTKLGMINNHVKPLIEYPLLTPLCGLRFYCEWHAVLTRSIFHIVKLRDGIGHGLEMYDTWHFEREMQLALENRINRVIGNAVHAWWQKKRGPSPPATDTDSE